MHDARIHLATRSLQFMFMFFCLQIGRHTEEKVRGQAQDRINTHEHNSNCLLECAV